MLACILIGLMSIGPVVTPRTTHRPIPADWKTYRDAVNDFSFRYPPNFRLSERSISGSGIDGLVRSLGLFIEGEYFPVLSLLVVDCSNPRAACYTTTRLKPHCDRFATFPLGNHDAIQCVDYGSAACHWWAYVLLEVKMVTFITEATDSAANSTAGTRSECADRLVPAMRAYPIEAIFSTFQFGGPPVRP